MRRSWPASVAIRSERAIDSGRPRNPPVPGGDVRQASRKRDSHRSWREHGACGGPGQLRWLSDLSEPLILVAPEIRPSQAAMFDKLPVSGIATEAGGSTGHAAVLASFGGYQI